MEREKKNIYNSGPPNSHANDPSVTIIHHEKRCFHPMISPFAI